MPSPTKKLLKGNVVMTVEINGGKVHFCDDYCRGMTKEDIDKILRKTADEMLPRLQAQHERMEREKASNG